MEVFLSEELSHVAAIGEHLAVLYVDDGGAKGMLLAVGRDNLHFGMWWLGEGTMGERPNSIDNNNLVAASLGATIQYGVATIQGLVAGNGGAIAALVAFKSGGNLKLFVGPLVVFSLGFGMSVICGFFSYLSQSAYTRSLQSSGPCGRCRGDNWRWAAVVTGLLAFVALASGGMWSMAVGLL